MYQTSTPCSLSSILRVLDEYILTCSIRVTSRNDYDEYTCRSSNAEGNFSLDVALQAPGVPDFPQLCQLVSVDIYDVVISCVAGYDGGEPLDFIVQKQNSATEPEEVTKMVPNVYFTRVQSRGCFQADSSFSLTENGVDITVTKLDPNTLWTLCTFQTNRYGRSHSSACVTALTTGALDVIIFATVSNTCTYEIFLIDGPPLPEESSDDSTSQLIAIIGGAVGGLLLVVIVVALVCFACFKVKPKRGDRTRFANSVISI